MMPKILDGDLWWDPFVLPEALIKVFLTEAREKNNVRRCAKAC